MTGDQLHLRNVVVHRYFRVDLDLLWRTIELDLPLLRAQVDALLTTQQ